MQKFQQAKVIYTSLVQIVNLHLEQFASLEQHFTSLMQNEEQYLIELSAFLELHYLLAGLMIHVHTAADGTTGQLADDVYLPRLFCQGCHSRNKNISHSVEITGKDLFDCCRYCGKVLPNYVLDGYKQDGRDLSGFVGESKALHKELVSSVLFEYSQTNTSPPALPHKSSHAVAQAKTSHTSAPTGQQC